MPSSSTIDLFHFMGAIRKKIKRKMRPNERIINGFWWWRWGSYSFPLSLIDFILRITPKQAFIIIYDYSLVWSGGYRVYEIYWERKSRVLISPGIFSVLFSSSMKGKTTIVYHFLLNLSLIKKKMILKTIVSFLSFRRRMKRIGDSRDYITHPFPLDR